MYKINIYSDGALITTATSESKETLEHWADEVCSNDENATYKITED